MLRHPSDQAECVKRLAKAVKQFPEDMHLRTMYGAQLGKSDMTKSVAVLKQAHDDDPQNAWTAVLLCLFQAYVGDF